MIEYNHMISSAEPNAADFEPHFHNVYEIEYIFQVENAKFAFSGTKCAIQENTLIVCPPMTIHNVRLIKQQTFDRIVIRFDEDFLDDDLKGILKNAGGVYYLDEDNLIRRLFFALSNSENMFQKDEFQEIAVHYLQIILRSLKYCVKTIEKPEINIANEKINDILTYIDDNITQELNAEIIAQHFFVSTSWLLHKFKECVNISLKKYINQKKLIHIERLIKAGIPINKIVESHSYNSYATFFRQYKKYMQKSPATSKEKNHAD